MADVIAINYARDAGWNGGLMTEICRGAESTAIVTYNYDDRPEIGVYRHLLPAPVFDQIAAQVRRSGYDRLPPPPDVPPETKFVTVGERRDGEALPLLRQFDLRAVPAPVSALGLEVEKVVEEIRKHRQRVIQADATWTRKAFDPGEPLALRLALRNAGVLPAALGNPLGAPRGTWCGLRLFLRAVAGGPESCVDLEPAHLRPAPGSPGDPIATLAPQGTLTFELKKKVYLVPGDYLARLSYQNVVENLAGAPQNPQLVRGELVLDLGSVRVARAGAAGA
jgi:hypothetical protein